MGAIIFLTTERLRLWRVVWRVAVLWLCAVVRLQQCSKPAFFRAVRLRPLTVVSASLPQRPPQRRVAAMNKPARCGATKCFLASVLQAAARTRVAQRERRACGPRRAARPDGAAPRTSFVLQTGKSRQKGAVPAVRRPQGTTRQPRAAQKRPRPQKCPVLQARDAPPAKVLQPADNPDVDVVPLRFGVKYASDAPMLALEYRDKASGELKLEEIPLAIKDDSKALEVYAALKESHARFLAPTS